MAKELINGSLNQKMSEKEQLASYFGVEAKEPTAYFDKNWMDDEPEKSFSLSSINSTVLYFLTPS